jgi:hypothetical protein
MIGSSSSGLKNHMLLWNSGCFVIDCWHCIMPALVIGTCSSSCLGAATALGFFLSWCEILLFCSVYFLSRVCFQVLWFQQP